MGEIEGIAEKQFGGPGPLWGRVFSYEGPEGRIFITFQRKAMSSEVEKVRFSVDWTEGE